MSDKTATTNGLIPSVKSNLPISTVNDSEFDKLATSTSFLGRLQLYSKGAAIMKKLIASGQYGIPEGDEKITVLGDQIDFVVLARRAKALDISDTENIVQNFDSNSDEFKRIAKESEGQDSGCMYGVSFLIFERSSARFLEYFAGTKTARGVCKDLYAHLPEKHADDAEFLIPVTATARLIEKGSYAWHAPVFTKCSTPIDLPEQDVIAEELTKFLNPDTSANGETVSDEEKEAVSGRRKR